MSRWPAAHLAVLNRLYPTWGAEPVAAATGRTVDAVRHMASRFNLTAMHHKRRSAGHLAEDVGRLALDAAGLLAAMDQARATAPYLAASPSVELALAHLRMSVSAVDRQSQADSGPGIDREVDFVIDGPDQGGAP